MNRSVVPASDIIVAMPAGRRGVTIIELLAVIGIIVLLVGLTLPAMGSLVTASEKRRTNNTLQLLEMTMTEWETESGRSLTWGNELGPPPAMPFDMVLTAALDRVLGNEMARTIFEKIDPSNIVRYEAGASYPWVPGNIDPLDFGELTVTDAWGTPIYLLHPGAPSQATNADPDGTERTYNELYYGTARNRKICFVSAGPDQQFGLVSVPPQTNVYKLSLDNMYSYPIR